MAMEAIASIHMLHKHENRKSSGSLNDCLVSVDGTDLRIPQQGPARKGNPFYLINIKGNQH